MVSATSRPDWERVASVVGDVVDAAAFDTARWQDVADELERSSLGIRVNLQAHGVFPDGPVMMVQSGWSHRFMESYARHFARINDVSKQWPNAPELTPMMLPEAFLRSITS